MEKNNKKVIKAWCSYDIANSAYNLIITSVLFPIYYQSTTKDAFGGEIVKFWGYSIKNTVLYDYTLAFAYFVIILLMPILSGIADFGGYRKRFMRFFTFMGSASCISLYWFSGNNLYFGLLAMSLAVIGYAGSLVYYNSFLPVIATPENHDRISARGFSWGYAGSMILLTINLLVISYYDSFGFETKIEALKFAFICVGIWWIGISQIAFYFLKDIPGHGKFSNQIITKGYSEIKKVFNDVRKKANIDKYLLAFFFYSMGVQTVMLVASIFGSAELGISGSKLILTILLIQLLGILGSFLFARISELHGNKRSILTMLVIWIAICIVAYYITNEYEFYALAAAVGLVMGGIQSQSRSTYAKLIPEGTIDTASYFSFYDLTEKASIVLGLFTFGLLDHITGSMRVSALSLAIFFIIGFGILLFAKLPGKRLTQF